MSSHLRCLRRALTLGGSMIVLGLMAAGPAAAADLGIDVTVPTLPPTTLPSTTLPPVESDPVSPLEGVPDTSVDTSVGGVTEVVDAVGTVVTGQTGDAVATVTGIIDPALSSILASVEGVLDLLNGTVHGLFPGSDSTTVPSVPGQGSSESSRSSGDPGSTEAARGAQGSESQPGSTAEGHSGATATGSAAAGSAPSVRSLSSLRRAALRASRDFALPFALGLLALGYLIFQSRTERHEPRLATDTEEELLRFR